MTTQHNTHDIIRRCRFAPYLKGMGPTFSLIVWDTHHTDRLGKSILGYSLKKHSFPRPQPRRLTVELFTGEDFACSPLHAIDSDECIATLMGFLTLRPGDTDAEYFANYTPTQLEFCEQYAESLACYCYSRFGEH
jgi:hypothetical protein